MQQFGQWRFTGKFLEGLEDAMRQRAAELGPIGIRITRGVEKKGGLFKRRNADVFTLDLVSKDGDVIACAGTTEMAPGCSLTLCGVQDSIYIKFSV